ncbi:MAG: ParB N-terminal domain-containing protein [Kiritimatiellae bacterium]|nr:ParB N-terminal domain-containing protein [Kiritimatiellia bacterium]
MLQPIVVLESPEPKGQFELLAGHMRYEACKKLGWKNIPAIVRKAVS